MLINVNVLYNINTFIEIEESLLCIRKIFDIEVDKNKIMTRLSLNTINYYTVWVTGDYIKIKYLDKTIPKTNLVVV